MNYQRYLASREWSVRRRAVLERSDGMCERCGSPAKIVHHLTYEHIGNEPLEDLQALCQGCHDFLHGASETDPAKRNQLHGIELFEEYLTEYLDRCRDVGMTDREIAAVMLGAMWATRAWTQHYADIDVDPSDEGLRDLARVLYRAPSDEALRDLARVLYRVGELP